MRTLRQVNIKNQISNQISFKSTDYVIYAIEYFKNLNSENCLYFIFNNVDAYIEFNSTKENNENKYLIFTSTGKKKEASENYTELCDKIKDQIETKIVRNQLNIRKIL